MPSGAGSACTITSGLDPISAGDFDALIRTLQQTLGLTVYMNTHDLDTLNSVCDRIAALADDIVRAENSPGDMLEVTRMLQRRALARAGQKKPLTEAEKCGFQCRYSLQMARRCKPFSHKHSQ